MADSFNKKEREKKKRKRKQDKRDRREQRKNSTSKPAEFMYVGEDGNLTTEPPDRSQRKKVKLEDIDISTGRVEKSTESKFSKNGIVKFFNTDKGYGFIDEVDSGMSYFVHVNSTEGTIAEGDRVVFEVGKGPKGPTANNVKLQS